MYAFTNVRAEMKATDIVRHSTPVATSQHCNEGGFTKSGCCPGGGLTTCKLASALLVRCVYIYSSSLRGSQASKIVELYNEERML